MHTWGLVLEPELSKGSIHRPQSLWQNEMLQGGFGDFLTIDKGASRNRRRLEAMLFNRHFDKDVSTESATQKLTRINFKRVHSISFSCLTNSVHVYTRSCSGQSDFSAPHDSLPSTKGFETRGFSRSLHEQMGRKQECVHIICIRCICIHIGLASNLWLLSCGRESASTTSLPLFFRMCHVVTPTQ